MVDARFVPPPPGLELDAATRDLVDWINSRTGRNNAVVDAAMAHYQFETLHPFNDGNGRLGRLLVVLQFLRWGTLSDPTLTVSPWFEARRSEYQDRLAAVSAEGEWDAWIGFFARGIEASAADTATRVDQLLAVQRSYQARVKAAGAYGIVRDVSDDLIIAPFVTVADVARRTQKSFQAASNAISKLTELGILREETGRTHHRLFAAPDVVAVLTGP